MSAGGRQIGVGCSAIDDPELREDCNSVFQGKHSYRTWDKVNFGKLMDACRDSTVEDSKERYECTKTVLSGFKSVESGRWNDSMNELHRFVSALDQDEVELFAENYPRLGTRINGYAKVQELRTFDEFPDELDNGEKLSRQ